MASNKYLINCLVLVQPDFKINEVLNSIIVVRVRGEYSPPPPPQPMCMYALGDFPYSFFLLGAGGVCGLLLNGII